MTVLQLYHGSQNRIVIPQFGLGDVRHDYGKGFYLTDDPELAKEWAVSAPNGSPGWVHAYHIDCSGLRILDFQTHGTLPWIAELMRHRDAGNSRRYRMLAAKFIDKYAVPSEDYDIIKGWRADASFFYIARAFVRDEIDIDILEELMHLGGLGIQYCLKSPKAFAALHAVAGEPESVSFDIYNFKYNERDCAARDQMKALIESDRNPVTRVFSSLLLE